MSAKAATWHLAPTRSLERLAATAGPAGLIVGRNRSGAFVPVRLLRAEPTRIALIGGLWAARLLVFRCLGLGAVVNVMTGNPSRWFGFDQMAGTPGRVHLNTFGATANPPSGSLQPVVHVYDTGPTTPAERPRLGPWQTQLTVLPRLQPNGAPIVTEANIVLLQRLSAQEATLCESILHQPEQTTQLLQRMHDDMVAIIAPGAEGYVWLAPTSVESELFGPPYRD
jgi:hypothetical protein